MELEKEGQIIAKVNRRKEIIKIRAEVNRDKVNRAKVNNSKYQ